ncbi:hypothetical protein GH733_010836 [Mirounga leonina]|nr:hypothetical protein GH733_010836 [Mirounga leonina]
MTFEMLECELHYSLIQYLQEFTLNTMVPMLNRRPTSPPGRLHGPPLPTRSPTSTAVAAASLAAPAPTPVLTLESVPPSKRPRGSLMAPPRIGTHNSTFHCDEALA